MTTARTDDRAPLRPLGVIGSLMIYVPAAVLLLVVTRWFIPRLSASTGIEPIFFWFLAGGIGVFLPLIITAALLLRAEGQKWATTAWTGRLRFARLRSSDLVWALGALLAAGAMGGLTMYAVQAVTGTSAHTPVFLSFAPLSPGRYWLLAVWLPNASSALVPHSTFALAGMPSRPQSAAASEVLPPNNEMADSQSSRSTLARHLVRPLSKMKARSPRR